MPNLLTTSPGDLSGPSTSQPLVGLCAGILPVWARHLATSRAQSEGAVSQMLKAFAEIGPHMGLAERQAQQITEALSQTDGGITRLTQACERALEPVLNDPAMGPAHRTALTQVLHMVRSAADALEEIAKPFTQETQLVAQHVERMYIGFQYQDRISQMMTLIEGDIARLQAAIANPAATAPDLASWLERLESQYAMAEQHQDHAGKAVAAGGSATGTDSNETTFF